MPQPMFFEPDPLIPEAALLGYGDLIMDDGTRQFVNGDPEIAALVPPKPEQVDTTTGPGAILPPGVKIGMDGSIQLDGGSDLGVTSVGQNQPLRSGAPSPLTNEPALRDALTDQAPDFVQSLEPDRPEPEPLPPGVQIGMDGSITTGGGGAPRGSELVTTERHGALPPDVANRQQDQLTQAHDEERAALAQARADEVKITREAELKEMARINAERAKLEDENEETQKKAERWQKEHEETEAAEIDKSLVGAAGVGGSLLAVVGAALMKGDGGLAMIDKMIDRSVREQVRTKETKLNRLAKQLGSAEQAIAAGKSRAYKLAADLGERTINLTKADIYEKHTPAVIGGLRTRQVKEANEEERISLGKNIDKLPTGPKPPDARMLEKYGALRRERAGNENMANRAEQEIGLLWVPGKDGKPGYYSNKADVAKRGFQGVGNIEQWVPDFIYSTMDQMTNQGYQVRGAAEAMAFANLKIMQPTGVPTQKDIDAAVKNGAYNTEEGFIRGLERIRRNNEEQSKHDSAQYGPDVVDAYEGRLRASGHVPLQGAAPGVELQPGSAREQLRQEREKANPKSSGNTAEDALKRQGLFSKGMPEPVSNAIPSEPKERMAQLSSDLQHVAGQELPPEGIAILLAQSAHETADGARMPKGNFFGHKSSAKSKAAGRGEANMETTEGAGADAKRVKQNFATFNTAAESAADHVDLLKRKYPEAWKALQAGDESAYVAALKDGGYFTGDEGEYLAGLQRRL